MVVNCRWEVIRGATSVGGVWRDGNIKKEVGLYFERICRRVGVMMVAWRKWMESDALDSI